MNALLISDIHIRHAPVGIETIVPTSPRDITLILGDIDTTYELNNIESVIRHLLKSSDVIYVLGNHEYYSPDFRQTPLIIKELLTRINKSTKHQAHLLHNEMLIYKNVRFIGGTLWSDIDFNNDGAVRSITNRTKSYNPYIAPHDLQKEHESSRDALLHHINTQFDGTTVVLTHHAPSYQSIQPKFESSETNSLYATNLEYILDSVDYWFHGHIHKNMHYVINNTVIACNPYGYAKKELDTGFDSEYIVKINDRG